MKEPARSRADERPDRSGSTVEYEHGARYEDGVTEHLTVEMEGQRLAAALSARVSRPGDRLWRVAGSW
jgi:hypothetical protein